MGACVGACACVGAFESWFSISICMFKGICKRLGPVRVGRITCPLLSYYPCVFTTWTTGTRERASCRQPGGNGEDRDSRGLAGLNAMLSSPQ